MIKSSSALGQLKDVHLPQEISIFPLAGIWYILMGIVVVITALGLWWILVKNRYKKQKLQAYALLAEIEKKQSGEMLSEISILIKRVAILKYPKEKVHTLFGEKWLEFLDKTGKTTNFSRGDGRLLLNVYQNSKIENPDKLFIVIKQWLGKVL